jgi:antiviral helicase SKI2
VSDFSTRIGTKYKRSGLDGRIVSLEEFTINAEESTSKNSLSLNRKLGSKLDFVRGRAGFMPFAPGGIDAPQMAESQMMLHRDIQGLFDIAPGLSRGLLHQPSVSPEISKELSKDIDEPDLQRPDVEDPQDEQNGLLNRMEKLFKLDEKPPLVDNKGVDIAAIDELLPQDITFGRTEIGTIAPPALKVKEWAHVVDVNKEITNFNELVPNPAREFPFELDVFQKEAVYHLEQGDSVFVAAHTSAGKTVVAEYAISMSNRNMTKTIYTSPIKALSNQKYRDFKQIYDDVGILTGDVQINPEASCLIMTTEILRSMLYRGADLIRDVEFVIFDEVHYVNDQDRGVVWEEVIIMLPDHVKFILLSATVPNTFEFANWVGRTKRKDIYVISTPKRPVPLENFLWCKNAMYKVVDEHKNFIESGWHAANAAVSPVPEKEAATSSTRGGTQRGGGGSSSRGGGIARGGGARGRGSNARGAARGGSAVFQRGSGRNANFPGRTDFLQLCQHLHKKNLLPVVIFIFSKKRCEELAVNLRSLDYSTAKEKSEIHMFIDKAVSRLNKEDRELPQILKMRDLLSRGIGVHHGGLLPIMKEVIEILFAKSLVKILFATETFAMGLNLPTRTVVFGTTSKHDGRSFRSLLPGEYTQMAGRAGRRGLDPTGTVILMVQPPEAPPMSALKTMMLGTPTKLQSQFRLTYNMILNLLRVEALKVEDMIKRSFSENSTQVMLPEHEKNVKLNEASLQKLIRDPCRVCDPDIDKVHELAVRQDERNKQIFLDVTKSPVGRRIVCPGRIVVYAVEGQQREVGIIVRVSLRTEKIHLIGCARMGDKGDKGDTSSSMPYLPMIKGYADKHLKPFVPVTPFIQRNINYSEVEMVTAMVSNVKDDIGLLLKRDKAATEKTVKQLEFCLKFQNKWHECDWSRLKDADVHLMLKERDECFEGIAASKAIKCPDFNKSFLQVREEYLIKKNIESLKQLISDQNLELLPDYEQRVEVLKDLNYIDEGLNVLLKGRVACEISSGFELIVTELVLDNFLGDYEPEEIVALMSAFVFEGNTQMQTDTVTPRLDQGKARILEIVNSTNQVFENHQVLMTQEEAEFGERNRFGLMEVVYEWARGMSFNSITELTDVQEGTIVRVISRMDEICREVMAAARIIGDSTLHDKMALAQEKIKRDIVFCASLYI